MCAQNQSNILQQFHNLSDYIGKVIEHSRYVEMACRRSFAEEYANGRLALVLYVPSIRDSDIPRRAIHSTPSVPFFDIPAFIFKFNSINGQVVDDWQEQPVFVQNVESVNGPNGLIPSAIRLYIRTS